MSTSFNNRRINELVDENYVYASVLFHLGIQFYDYSEKTLEEACEEHGLNLNNVIRSLEASVNRGDETNPVLKSYPIDLIIEYLKHAHHIFVKRRLPYLAKIIETLDEKNGYQSICSDLKFVFPLFVEDFIHHIYEEEDNLFGFILDLQKFNKGKLSTGKLYYQIEKFSIRKYAAEHEAHDDEMNGIRRITGNYSVNQKASLHLTVVYAELQAFERELKIHSMVENNILFPKAINLEKKALKTFRQKINDN
ncbi:MAG TPA: iron-sulfur cluster repair di-iron protein [Cyclobacteriaceae bacterium]|jgi:regulator of cell morphogenesis and NO signaling